MKVLFAHTSTLRRDTKLTENNWERLEKIENV